MTIGGFLKSIETLAGQTIGVLRENGQVEDCFIVDPADVGGGEALTALWFADAGAAPGGTGTIGAPFNTFAGAITAAQADFTANNRDQTIVCVPGDYSGEALQTLTLAPGRKLTVTAWATPAAYGVLVQPWLPALALPGVGVGLVIDGVSWVGVTPPQVDVGGDVSAVGCFLQSVNCDRLRASLSQVGSGTMLTSAEYDQTLLGTGFTCPISRIRGIRQPSAAAFTGDVEIDAYSNNGQITASGTFRVVGKAAQETLNLVVPVVPAGEINWVDGNFVAGLASVATDTPIVCCPTENLAGTGAPGGGYLNCRVIGTGQVRVVFIGPLAGGASNFVFGSLSYPF